jgi:hypothetical protein
MTHKPGLVVENDGEVAIVIPVRGELGRFLSPYRRTRTQRRGSDDTRDQFRENYPVMDESEEKKLNILGALKITQQEMFEAMQKARSERKERQLLIDLVRSCRKERVTPK